MPTLCALCVFIGYYAGLVASSMFIGRTVSWLVYVISFHFLPHANDEYTLILHDGFFFTKIKKLCLIAFLI